MSIVFTCSCGRKLQIRDEFAGKEGKCPSCGKIFVIPTQSEPSQEVLPADAADDLEELPEVDGEEDHDRDRDGGGRSPARLTRDFRAPEALPNHGDGVNPRDADFFVEPPPEIGPLVNANTTLRKHMRPWDTGPRLGLVLGIGGAGVLLGGLISVVGIAANSGPGGNPGGFCCFGLIAMILGGVGSLIALYATGFKHTCTYVGRDGVARFVCSGSRDKLKTDEVFLFREAAELRTAQTRRYVNGVYQGTNYSFTWTDVGGRKRYALTGTHNSEGGTPASTHIYHFARATELAWTLYLAEEAYRRLETGSDVRFKLAGRKSIRLRRGSVVFDWGRDDPERWDADEIREAQIHQGVVRIRHVDAQEGWFSSSGVYKFDFSELANAQLFFHLMDKVVGVPVR